MLRINVDQVLSSTMRLRIVRPVFPGYGEWP
jgi:hypothetical protein